MKIQALCEKGPVRDNNEDMVSVGGILLRDDQLSIPVELDVESVFHLLVADGMGGHEHGERASEMLLQHLNNCFQQKLFTAEDIENQLTEQVHQLSERLNSMAAEESQQMPMGCTLTGMVWFGGKVYLLNAGDSRTYRFRPPYLRQLTYDQTERGMTGNPNDSKLLLNCIGGGSYGHLIVEDITDKLDIGDIILVCSDGLTDMVDNGLIERMLAESDDPAHDLYDLACEHGGYDNISIIVATLND